MSKPHTCVECGLNFEGKHAIVTKDHVDSILCLECVDNLIDEDTKVLAYELEVDGKVVAKEGDMSDEDEDEDGKYKCFKCKETVKMNSKGELSGCSKDGVFTAYCHGCVNGLIAEMVLEDDFDTIEAFAGKGEDALYVYLRK